MASWVALEDIGPEAGLLMYVPRLHRMPWFGVRGRLGELQGEDR